MSQYFGWGGHLKHLTILVIALSFPAWADVVFRDVEPIVKAKCAVCHQGPFLDFRVFPFSWDQSKDLQVLGREMARRIQTEGRGGMPPVNGTPLSEPEKTELLDWIRGGMLP